jgi:uncharacterized protein YciI
MQQYVIIGNDGDDEGALQRRLSVRPAHFDGVRRLKESNNYIFGGAILDDEGVMKGSVMVVQFESEEDLRHWYDNEPYVTGNVWKKVEIKKYKVAEV